MRKVTLAAVRGRLSRYGAVIAPRRRLRRLLGRPEMSPVGVIGAPGSPADFSAWLSRIGGRNVAGYPEVWKTRPDLPIERPARVAAVVHVFFPELLPGIVSALATIPVEFDLWITNASATQVTIDASALPNVREIRVLDLNNHGRDILPLVHLVNAGLLDPYELVVKVHTKKSQWRAAHDLGGSGESWRESLLEDLLGSTERVRQLMSVFAGRPDVGVVTGDDSVFGPNQWGDNQQTARTLMRRLELGFDEDSLQFPAGSMYWIRGFLLQGLRALNLSSEDFEHEAGQVNATTAHALERMVGLLTTEAGQRVEQVSTVLAAADQHHGSEGWRRFAADSERTPRARVVPFYLPQFHPIAENDRWWGTGFTEWTNVAAARPVYDGHHQPRIPRDLGFYDLRLDSVRRQQVDLAQAHGIAGFMYYYYWFAGKRLLQAPIEAMAVSDLDFPFCIMWANENWTRRWDGRENDILIGQNYAQVPAEDFIDDVMEFLLDPRYLRIDGNPVLSVYRPGQMHDFPHVVEVWRERALARGLKLHLVGVDVATEFDALKGSVAESGLDGLMGFPPHNHLWSWLPHEGLGIDPRFDGNLLSYAHLVRAAEKKLLDGVDRGSFPGVMVTFDNTARRQWASDLWFGSNPYTFRRWLRTAVTAVAARPAQERVVFVNAWNEWAEGAVLEPSDRFGSTYLLAVRDVVDS
jgi:lipopolysaccharide biosynthesis protein